MNVALLVPLLFARLNAQESQTAILQSILQRMEALEKQNRQMAQEIHDLRRQLEVNRAPEATTTAAAPLDERVAVAESRIEEQAQTKVEASQKFPITLTGQLLFNAFANTGRLQPLTDATYNPLLSTTNTSGATFRQTMFGFNYRGPTLPGDGKLNAHIMMDFYSGFPSEQLDWLRIRTSDISLDWQHRSVTFAYDKPLISARQPNSLAEVSIPPLADAGNLWLWLPQIKYEERFKLGASAGLTAQAALLQTDESYNYAPPAYSDSLEKSRPAVEGRLGIWKSWSDHQRLEIAGGFHSSASHIAHETAASRIFSVDWLVAPFSKLEITGTFFRGKNFGALGALSGIEVSDSGIVNATRGDGGWTQFSTPLTSRLTLNLFAGFQSNRASGLQISDVTQNLSYAGNLMYHLTPNVILSFEGLQLRSRLKQDDDRIRNRYDLAIAYLF